MTGIKSKHIQILRGLAIIAVVMIHTDPDGLAQVFYRPFLNFAVGLFLFISGMLSNTQTSKPFKRISKVIIPYTIWSLIYFCINFSEIIPSIGIYSSFKLWIRTLIFANSEIILYFIPVYCQLTLLIPLIDKISKTKFKYLAFLISPVEIVIMRMIPLISGYQLPYYVSVLRNISCIGWFSYHYLGYLMGNKYIKCKKSNKQLLFYTIPAIVLQVAEGLWWHKLGSGDPGAQLKLSSLLTGLIFAIIAYNFVHKDKEYNNKLLVFLGNNSFAIYFSHIAVINLLTLLPGYSKYAMFPLNTVLVIAADVLLITVFKKILGKYSKFLGM